MQPRHPSVAPSTHTRAVPLLMAVCGVLGSSLAAVRAAEDVDTSEWVCKFCEFEQGFSGEIELGAGHVSDDSSEFGEYNGLEERGTFSIVDFETRYRGEEGGYYDIRASDLALDTRSLRARAGAQGSYDLFLRYQERPHLLDDTARTPFAGAGTDMLTLPPGWVEAGSTAGMTALAASLRDIELSSERERMEAGAILTPAERWQTGVRVSRETKEGLQRGAGAFFFTASHLPLPVDYETDEVEAFLTYARSDWQIKVAYLASTFDNGNESLTWENPFSPLAAGADQGELSLAPDNEFHQVMVSGGFQLSDDTHASGEVALGQMKQNEDFLAPTRNASLSVADPPRSSLDARVDTINTAVRLTSRVSERWRVNAAYHFDEHDNRTRSDSYEWVTTDTFIATARENQPYSFIRREAQLSAQYLTEQGSRVSAGIDHENMERDLQEVNNTIENRLWTRWRVRPADELQLDVELARARRRVSGYNTVDATEPPQNPLLRKFNMADRTREEAGLQSSFALSDDVNATVGVKLGRDDYSRSQIGLTGADDYAVDGTLSLALSRSTSLYLFLAQQVIDSQQAGSNTFAGAEWEARERDTVNSGGIGVRHAMLDNNLDLGADYTVSESRAQISVSGAAFPDLTSRVRSLQLYADYRVNDAVSLRLRYLYEQFTIDDWMLDDVGSDTIPSVISFGEDAAAYDVQAVSLAARYRF